MSCTARFDCRRSCSLAIGLTFFPGEIPSGLPNFDVPKFSITNSNGTVVGFFDMVSNVGPGIIVLPIIGLIETISICKTFGECPSKYDTKYFEYFRSCILCVFKR